MINLSRFFLILLAVCMPLSASANHNSEASKSERTAPVGQVYREGDAIPNTVVQAITEQAVAEVRTGETIYTSTCSMCHASGAANAPIFTDKTAWEPRLEKGLDAVVSNAINGTAAGMPPKGMCMDCSDDEIKAAVEYMVESIK